MFQGVSSNHTIETCSWQADLPEKTIVNRGTRNGGGPSFVEIATLRLQPGLTTDPEQIAPTASEFEYAAIPQQAAETAHHFHQHGALVIEALICGIRERVRAPIRI